MIIFNLITILKRQFFICIVYLILYSTTNALESSDIVILVLSQENSYHSNIAYKLEQNIIQQSKNDPPLVYLSHRDFPHIGDWTVLPLLPRLFDAHKNNSHWLFVCNERTKINLKKLIEVLEKYNEKEDIWIGQALYDREVTIIHHFAFIEDPTSFLYPNIAAGFAISMPLLMKISDRFAKEQYKNPDNEIDFSIDASHELSLFIWDENKGISLTHHPEFCSTENENDCATNIQSFVSCGDPVPNDSLYFAVKTCKKFHEDRVNIVKKTWGKYVKNIQYFSDIEDNDIPTISLNIPNTNHGHCEKTFGIIKYVHKIIQNNSKIKWLIITDDDTIISPNRLKYLLSCYRNNETIALGERYGYRVQNLEQQGYNYITGGGGTVLSSGLVKKIIENADLCKCPRRDSPDDMILGVCLARLDIKLIHSPHFHQARPNDYPPEYLCRQEAISFHKHWDMNPEEIYKEWFETSDKNELINDTKFKTEL